MLVLTRRQGESICVGDDVRIRVVSISGKKIRLGIDAPASVRVDRQEVRERMEEWVHEVACVNDSVAGS